MAIRKKAPDKEKLRLRMAGLCAQAEHCEHEIREKLMRAGLPPDDADEIVEFLKAKRFIDDQRFASAFASDKMRFSRWGRRKIAQALYAKRISGEAVREALSNFDEEEYREKAMQVAQAKARDLNLLVRDDQMKLYRHLLSRGFEGNIAVEVCRSIVRRVREDAENEEGE